MDPVRRRLAELIAAATDGEVSAGEIATGEHSLRAVGVGSLAFLRLADALEAEFGVELDLQTPGLETFDGLLDHLAGDHLAGGKVRP